MNSGSGLIQTANSGNTRDYGGQEPGLPAYLGRKAVIRAVFKLLVETIL